MMLGRRWRGMPEIWGKLTLRPNLCYFFLCEKNWLREEDRLGDFARAKRLQNLVGTEIALEAAESRIELNIPSYRMEQAKRAQE
jgi:hypothetical protein